ncbi:hypothetical protein BU16DRAFT_530913 [Lophium mytilinum]|uniref:Alpha/beta hydrolase fold-3 domain-containing protein n=1 Tax=Lophium mytilinum TaxID=390894 RepID=A0A6A6QE43_9PEZI|nr:hypothetical protein BU16DRAFT_530913 [Lophium mytilinum]
MLSITTDAWDDEVWGAAHPSPTSHPRAQLRFLFGTGDHWVAEETRDDLIRTRALKQDSEADEAWKPKMEVNEEGWPHAFCIRHSIPVAEKVAEYVRDTIRGDKQDVDQQN